MPSRTKINFNAKFNRRTFTAMCGASALAPMVARGQSVFPSNPDVVIVGAGAAGIAAAHKLREAGVSFVLVEAAAYIGGRAITENSTFGVPFDHGAHWVQNTTRNSYFNRAKQGSHRFYKTPGEYRIFNDSGPATNSEEEELWNAWAQVEKAMGAAGKGRQDVSPASIAPNEGDWAQTAWFGIGAWEMGKDMEDFSCLDWWESADSVDWYCDAGFGTLVSEHGANVPVSLETTVSKIKWGDAGVTVTTSRGDIQARAVILTVSTGVLADESIKFDPPLPVAKQESFHAISMGYYNHIALHFSEDIFEMGEDGYVLHKVDQSNEAFGTLTNASGFGLAYCDVGGAFARDLELAGSAAAIDFVTSTLRNMIGSDVDKYLTNSLATEWGNDPFVRGCYASARPGEYPMRDVLRAPVGERIFFAGEACHEDMWATVGGADASGSSVALMVADTLV